MSSHDFQPNDPRDKTDAKSETDEKPKWVMTQKAFDKLLNAFSPDREEAGKQYERVRLKLFRLFEWQALGSADELADETFNRVARRMDEGQKIDNLIGYIYGVARIVCKEVRKKPVPISLDDTSENQRPVAAPETTEPDARLRCFDQCLDKLSGEKRRLIVDYYQYEGRDKIKWRQKLADQLGIPLNALRIRAHRIRMTLENCITKCVESYLVRND